MAEKINNFFIKNVTDTANDRKKNPNKIKFSSVPHSMMLENADINEVTTIINNLKNSAAGYDNITTTDVKMLCNELCPLLCHLINAIISTGKYPDEFKFATVKPIRKNDNSNNINDLRPISILSTFNKIVEKFLYNRIMKYIDKHQLISKNQFGFRPRSCTETAALELVGMLRKSLDNKKIASIVFMDLKKAFDLVDRKILMKMLNLIGIRGKTEEILLSYFTQRMQVVKVGSKVSNPIEVIYGVIQGSVLGSLLFNIFFNEITKLDGLSGKIILYADDIALINEHGPKDDITNVIRNDMSIILEFLDQQKMILNAKKTNYMMFYSPYIKCNQPTSIKINEEYTISEITTFKYLGLHLDPHLKWDIHLEVVGRKLAAASNVMWKLKRILPLSAKKKDISLTICNTYQLYVVFMG